MTTPASARRQTWYQGWRSPYYNESHVTLRAYVRAWVDQHIAPNCHEWDEQKSIPKSVFQEFAKSGLANTVCGPILQPQDITYSLPCGLTAKTFDVFHELIIVDEFSRPGSGGVVWSLFGGLSIGLPPVMLFASKALRDRVVKPCLAGDKVICLAITEPTAGSDVAALKCTAVLNKEKTHYVVNGVKKWVRCARGCEFCF